METPRRAFLTAAAGAVTLPLLALPPDAAAAPAVSYDSRLMGAPKLGSLRRYRMGNVAQRSGILAT